MVQKVKGNPKNSTQVYLDIDYIKDGLIVLKNGEYRAILECGGVNFFLRSEDEQSALIYRYQDFLNSLKFPVQIVVQSRFLDLDFYITELRDRINKQESPLMMEQTKQYTIFVEQIVEQINVMEKRFFIVVPWMPTNVIKTGFIDKIKDAINPANVVIRNQSEFEKNKMELMQRVDAISSAASGLGIASEALSTQKLIDLFYRSYNPNSSQKQHLKETESLDSDVILGRSSMKNDSQVKIFSDD